MKHVGIFGILTLLLALSFTPPPHGEYHAAAQEFVHDTSAQKTPHSLATFPSLEKAQQTLERNIAYASDIILSVSSVSVQPTDVTQATVALTQQAHKAVQTMQKAPATVKSVQTWEELLKMETNPLITDQLDRITHAVKTANSDECRKLGSSLLPLQSMSAGAGTLPSTKDMMMYCLAKVTRVRERCDDISQTIALPLYSLCHSEVHS